MSNVPSGQVAAFPALTLEMRRVLVGEVEDFATQIRALEKQAVNRSYAPIRGGEILAQRDRLSPKPVPFRFRRSSSTRPGCGPSSAFGRSIGPLSPSPSRTRGA